MWCVYLWTTNLIIFWETILLTTFFFPSLRAKWSMSKALCSLLRRRFVVIIAEDMCCMDILQPYHNPCNVSCRHILSTLLREVGCYYKSGEKSKHIKTSKPSSVFFGFSVTVIFNRGQRGFTSIFGSSGSSYKCSEYSTKHNFPLDLWWNGEVSRIDCDIRETQLSE